MAHEITSRMQRPELLGLLHEILQNDLVTAKVQAPAVMDAIKERYHETAIIAVPRRSHAVIMTASFLASFVVGFALTMLVV